MSSKHRIVFVTPPLYGSLEERFTSRGHRCGYCQGKGGFAVGTPYGDSGWKPCPVCKGSGRMDAEVTVKWKPQETDKQKHNPLNNEDNGKDKANSD